MGTPQEITPPNLLGDARQTLDLPDGEIFIISDMHFWPGVDSPAHRAYCYLNRVFKPKVNVWNGDAFDGAAISRFPRIGWDSKPKVKDEIVEVKAKSDEVVLSNQEALRYWPLGNHDARFETFLASRAPEMEGVPGFTLQDHFPDWTPCWSLWINDDVVIKHRINGGIHAARNNTIKSGKTTVTGHTHQLSICSVTDYTGTRWGIETGTGARPLGPQFLDYTEDNPKNWTEGFIVLTFRDGRLLWPEPVVIGRDGDSFSFRGEIWKL